MRLLLLVLVTCIMLVAGAPATLVDRMFAEASGASLRLSVPVGTIWRGGGFVHVLDAGTRLWKPWCRVEWSFDPIGLFRGRAAWQIITNGTNVSSFAMGFSGAKLSGFRISGPAQYFLQRIPGAFGGFGWDGDIALDILAFECSWRGQCTGRADAGWVAAGSNFLPGQVFGDYRVELEAAGGTYTFNWSSSGSSKLRINGKGGTSASGGLWVAGDVQGDPALLGRLPAVAGPWVRPTPAPDTWKIAFP